jgi:putative phosphoesterase
MLIGLISDTHGLLRPEALRALGGAGLILHAGDVGGPVVLSALEGVAPVKAVGGNVDPPEERLPASLDLTLEGVRVHVSHGHELGAPTPAALLARYDADVIVFGHTHKALIEQYGMRLVVNPGAAGPRRFNLQPTVALLRIEPRAPRARAEIVALAIMR